MPNAHPRRLSAAATSRRPSTLVAPYARLTAAILAETTTAGPWTPPWHGAEPLPRNSLTGRPYRGINMLALWAAAQRASYVDPRWATYRQWAALGAQVRWGERGTVILFCRDREAEDGNSSDAERDAGDASRRFVARASTMFNADQVDGALDQTATAALPVPEPKRTIDAFAAVAGARLVVGSTWACYVPTSETIRIPPL